ncbi:hypothetical protein LTR36_004786 [Oleoguttula mirabilis]|uniref:Heterokaryon incompatibility domain-containing protein n=1 Tax=Oleoguttula mirabilis TaxID=1507867 RepID=A0AAV9JEM0_9PEZI|nr:hypothetical protein LTR36_004786 [Oleoguttula mirabilis]
MFMPEMQTTFFQAGYTRVLLLAPGRIGTPLQATLEAVPVTQLRDEMRYEAISYAWGALALPRTINLAGDGTMVSITESLYQALQHFRHADRVRRLWADALCINQSPLALSERSAQVAIISDIFGAATKVLVWLGVGDEHDSLAFAVGKLVFTDWQSMGEDAWLERESPGVSSCGCCDESFQPPDGAALAVLRAVGNLLYRGWFARVWTLQELAVSESDVTICSGFHHAPWPVLVDAFNVWFSKAGPTPAALLGLQTQAGSFADATGFLWRTDVRVSASNLLEIVTSARQCSNPRDRIFSMRQILGLKEIDSLRPDYTLTLVEVYRRARVAAVEQPADTQGQIKPLLLFRNHVSIIFGMVGTEAAHADDSTAAFWPSWIPKFHRLTKRSRTKVLVYPALNHDRFHAKLDETVPHKLWVRGRSIATVQELLLDSVCPWAAEDRVENSQTYWDIVNGKLLPWYDRCVHFITRYVDADTLQKHHLVQSLLSATHSSASFDPAPSLDEFAEQYAMLLANVCTSTVSLRDRNAAEVYKHLRPFLDYDVGFDVGRQLGCVLMGNAIRTAWLPATAQPGDEVRWFGGAAQPVALRRAATSSAGGAVADNQSAATESWKLLGDVWVEGMGSDCDA